MEKEVFNVIEAVAKEYELEAEACEENPYIAYIDVTHCSYSDLTWCYAPLDTMVLTKRGYNAFTDLLDRQELSREDYAIYFCYDVSGYEYWTHHMQESLHVSLRIGPVRPDINLTRLKSDIEHTVQDFMHCYNSLLQKPYNVRKQYR